MSDLDLRRRAEDEKKMLVDCEGRIWDKVKTDGCFVSGDGGDASWELSGRTIKDDEALIAGGCEVIKKECKWKPIMTIDEFVMEHGGTYD